MYGGMNHGLFAKSCLDLQAICAQYGVNVKFSFLFNESLIQRARNYLADEFLRSDSTHLMFIDSDIHFNPNDVITLLAMDRDIAGGPYPKKQINWRNIYEASHAKNEEGNFKITLETSNLLESMVGDYVFNPVAGVTQNFQVTEPLEVMEIGTGFMLIKRETFDRFREVYPELSYKPDHHGQANFDGSREIHAYFHCDIDPATKRYLSEDYFFCQKSRAAGKKVWLCPWMRLTHIGTYPFKGDMPMIAQITGCL
jgi:hypothetical protein